MTPGLDLAFRMEDGQGLPLPAALQPLLAAAGRWADAAAEPRWQALLSDWLASLQPQLPAALVSPAYSLGLQLTDDATITALNGQWRQLHQPTDVLAFAAQESQESAEALLPPQPWPSPGGSGEACDGADPCLELGDIVISLETAARQAGAEPEALAHELLFLASHGLLHLLGWDHPDDASLAAMLTLQQELLDRTAGGSGKPAGRPLPR